MAEGTRVWMPVAKLFRFGGDELYLMTPSELAGSDASFAIGCAEEIDCSPREGWGEVRATLADAPRLAAALEEIAGAIRKHLPPVLADGVSTKEASS